MSKEIVPIVAFRARAGADIDKALRDTLQEMLQRDESVYLVFNGVLIALTNNTSLTSAHDQYKERFTKKYGVHPEQYNKGEINALP